jgi:hypothetical protein
MRDRPTGTELADLVQRIEDGDGSVEVPYNIRYRELMMASARAIAERQRDTGDVPERRERDSLIQILDKDDTLEDLNWALAEGIREGLFDPEIPISGSVRDHLWQTALDRVRESNPKVLEVKD